LLLLSLEALVGLFRKQRTIENYLRGRGGPPDAKEPGQQVENRVKKRCNLRAGAMLLSLKKPTTE
jgi:hypothetical protein